ncbi:uncharacterized protein LOC130613549 [Hydractinia symbiolongicarpus]|uniref:uncharacterized protein LOC130613549 n=1 Tax=Hydractinia symbiolongicarpus TaxID=13093 RepID=UPI00254D9A99|nr:uncharacterized protein LOC130613549 [Hydractinia symbiolongicarpus]
MSSNRIENVICHICNKIALNNCILCDLCNTWLHVSCLKMTKSTFNKLSQDEVPWFCRQCIYRTLPCTTLTDITLNSLTFNSCISDNFKECDFCNKNIKCVNSTVTCSTGKHKVHLKCANLNKTKLKSINIKNWICSNCNSFPFNDMDSEQLFNLMYNSSLDKYDNSYLINKNLDDLLNLPKLEIEHPNNIGRDDASSSVLNFNYYSLEDFHKLTQSKQLNAALSFLHTNIRSYQKNISNLCDLVHTLEYKFDIIGLSEAWHSSGKEINSITLSGYHPYEFISGNSQNAGCGFYINSELKYIVRDDLSGVVNESNEEFEILFIEIFNDHSKNILVGVIYRHPKCNTTEFLAHMQKLLFSINKENKKIVIMGDFNINLLQFEEHQEPNSFLEIMLSNFLLPHIIQPTRIAKSCKYTLIDNIFYNDILDECISGNLIPHITDHLPNFLAIEDIHTSRVKNNKKVRDYTKFNTEEFRNELMGINKKQELTSMDDVNLMYNVFHDNLTTVIDKHAPLKPMSKTQLKRSVKPWINDHMLLMIKEKNQLYGMFMRSGNRNKNQNTPTAIKQDGKTFTDPKDIASLMNLYYANVAPELVKKLPKISPQEVEDHLSKLDHTKAVDVYNFPIKFIKQNCDLLSEPLSIIINKSFSEGVFPDALKYAKVIPLFKNGTRHEAKNYRPVSILPLFDKIIEKIMHKKLMTFLDQYKIISPSQYGFQKGIRHSKPYYTTKKLEHYGIRGIANKWFKSYLSGRTQSVSVSNILSSALHISCGVPQGSILGPILFLLYINDISNASPSFKYTLFADDTSLFIDSNNKQELFKKTNNELTSVCDWLIANALSLNVTKSNYLFFSKEKHVDIPEIKLLGKNLTRKNSVKYLGIIIDDELSWDNHIQSVLSRILQGIGILRRLGPILPCKSLLSIYYSLV